MIYYKLKLNIVYGKITFTKIDKRLIMGNQARNYSQKTLKKLLDFLVMNVLSLVALNI